jgi:hypothetical protein
VRTPVIKTLATLDNPKEDGAPSIALFDRLEDLLDSLKFIDF